MFTRNTTDAVNMLAAALPAGTEVLVFASEHHANLLPWRRGDVTCLPVPSSPGEALELLERALAGRAGRSPTTTSPWTSLPTSGLPSSAVTRTPAGLASRSDGRTSRRWR